MAQNTYKCGETYSQSPCVGGVIVNSSDPRTPGQKAQTDAAVTRDAQQAEALRKARLAQEQADLRANTSMRTPPAPVSQMPASSAPAVAKKPKKPQHFTAIAPKDKTKAAKKTAGKRKANTGKSGVSKKTTAHKSAKQP